MQPCSLAKRVVPLSRSMESERRFFQDSFAVFVPNPMVVSISPNMKTVVFQHSFAALNTRAHSRCVALLVNYKTSRKGQASIPSDVLMLLLLEAQKQTNRISHRTQGRLLALHGQVWTVSRRSVTRIPSRKRSSSRTSILNAKLHKAQD